MQAVGLRPSEKDFPVTLTDVSLVDILGDTARDGRLRGLLAPHPTERTWTRLRSTDDLDLWLISWPPGTRTDWHDHGSAAGAFTLLEGALVEHSWDGALRLSDLAAGHMRAFGPGHVHDVRNVSGRPALSLHAYTPRLETMTRYRFLGDRVEVQGVDILGVAIAGEEW